jgi:hypothetical protein
MADSATDFHDFERGKGNAYGEGAEEPQVIVEAASGWTKAEGCGVANSECRSFRLLRLKTQGQITSLADQLQVVY